MRSFKRLKLLLIASLVSLVAYVGILAYREFYLFQRFEVAYWVGIGLLVLFPLLHIFFLFTIGNIYYPDKEIRRFYRIGFHITAGLCWLSFALFLAASIMLIVNLFETENVFDRGDFFGITLFSLFLIIVVILLAQLISGYKFVAFITRKQKEFQFLESFN